MSKRSAFGKAATIVCARPYCADVFDAFERIQLRHNESDRATMLTREWLALQSIHQEYVVPEQVLQQNARGVSIESSELDVVATRAGPRARGKESLIKIAK